MRETKINDADTLKIHASPMTCVIYESEFDGADIVTDIATASEKLNYGIMRRSLWAMAKTASPATVPKYNAWMNSISSIDYMNRDWLGDVLTEAKDAFFPNAAEAASEKDE